MSVCVNVRVCVCVYVRRLYVCSDPWPIRCYIVSNNRIGLLQSARIYIHTHEKANHPSIQPIAYESFLGGGSIVHDNNNNNNDNSNIRTYLYIIGTFFCSFSKWNFFLFFNTTKKPFQTLHANMPVVDYYRVHFTRRYIW